MTSKKQAPTPPPPPRPRKSRAAPKPDSQADQHEATADGVVMEEVPTFNPLDGLLTPIQYRFVTEYLIDLNGTQAYLRVNPDVQTQSAGTEAHRLLKNPHVAREIQRRMNERATVTGITADRVLHLIWDRATADPRDLVQLIVGSCRHCWGLYNQYQYTDAEFSLKQDLHIKEQAKKKKAEGTEFKPAPFPEKGGTGYDPKRPPNPDCPECWGDGKERRVLKDTRDLSPGAAALFGGLKVTKEGDTIVMLRDNYPAVQDLARHVGLLNDKFKLPEGETNPLMALLEEIRGSTGAGSTLQIAHDDPEIKANLATVARSVQDVVAKPPKPPAAGKWKAV